MLQTKTRQRRNILTMPSGRKDDTDLELPSFTLIRFLKTLETSLGHCYVRLRLS